MMTIEEILAGESKNVEFKENLPEKSIKYMKSVVAFANGTGGKLIFGIADKTREVVGFDKEEVFKKMDAIANAVSDSCEPAIIPDITLRTVDGMKKGYSKIRNEALAHAFSYMNLIEHWGSGIPRIIGKVKAAGLREPEFIGGEVDLRINIYRGQIAPNDLNGLNNGNKVPDITDEMPDTTKKVPDSADKMPDNEQEQQIYKYILKNGFITTAEAVELLGVKHRRARAVLLDMVEGAYLKKEGAARSTIYVKNTEGR